MGVLLWLLSGIQLFALQAPAQEPFPQVLSEDNWNLAIGQVAMLITTIAGFVWNAYREARNRRWDLEDRARQTNQLRVEVVEQHAVLKEAADQKQVELLDKLSENTEISRNAAEESKKAAKEANDVNQKIARLSELYDGVRGRTASLERKNEDKGQ